MFPEDGSSSHSSRQLRCNRESDGSDGSIALDFARKRVGVSDRPKRTTPMLDAWVSSDRRRGDSVMWRARFLDSMRVTISHANGIENDRQDAV